MDYFDIRDVMRESPNTHIFNIVGQGGVGKTYSVKKFVLLDFLQNGKKFIYVRRWTTEIQTLDTVFLDIWNNLCCAYRFFVTERFSSFQMFV